MRTSKFLFETILWCIKCQHFIWYTCPSTKHEKIHFSVEVPKRWVLNLRNFKSAGFVSWFCSFFPQKIKIFEIVKTVKIFVFHMFERPNFSWKQYSDTQGLKILLCTCFRSPSIKNSLLFWGYRNDGYKICLISFLLDS